MRIIELTMIGKPSYYPSYVQMDGRKSKLAIDLDHVTMALTGIKYKDAKCLDVVDDPLTTIVSYKTDAWGLYMLVDMPYAEFVKLWSGDTK